MKPSLYALTLSLLAFLVECGGSGGSGGDNVVAVSGNGIVPNFSIENRYGWEVDQQPVNSTNQEDILYLNCPDDVADHPVFSLVSLSISTKQLEDGVSAEAFAEEHHKNETLFTNDPTPLESVSLTNEKGWTFQYKFAVGELSIVDVYLFNVDETMYIINATTTEELYESHSKTKFQTMLDTFDIETTD